MTSAPAKIEVAASISLDDTITRSMTDGNYFGSKLINFISKGKKIGYKILVQTVLGVTKKIAQI